MVTSFTPHSLEEALRMRENPELIPYTGGTDLMVNAKEDANYLFLHRVPEMKQILQDNEYIRFGASCTFAEVIQHPLTPKILREACLKIAAPAIRNAGSIGGNVANGSPKADSALIFMVAGSRLRLCCAGGERVISIKDFYLGRKKLALRPDELLVEVLMPRCGLENYYHVKVGARNALAISRVSFAGIMDIKASKINRYATAFGAVSDVIICPEQIDKMFAGKTIAQARALKDAYLSAMDEVIIPIRGRVGTEYRKDVCINLLRDFLEVNGI